MSNHRPPRVHVLSFFFQFFSSSFSLLHSFHSFSLLLSHYALPAFLRLSAVRRSQMIYTSPSFSLHLLSSTPFVFCEAWEPWETSQDDACRHLLYVHRGPLRDKCACAAPVNHPEWMDWIFMILFRVLHVICKLYGHTKDQTNALKNKQRNMEATPFSPDADYLKYSLLRENTAPLWKWDNTQDMLTLLFVCSVYKYL